MSLACFSIFRSTDGSSPSLRCFLAASRRARAPQARPSDRCRKPVVSACRQIDKPAAKLGAARLNQKIQSATVESLTSFLRGLALRMAVSVSGMVFRFLVAGIGRRRQTRYQQKYQQNVRLPAIIAEQMRTNLVLATCFCRCFGRPRTSANKKWCPGAESNHRHRDFQSPFRMALISAA